MTTKIYELDSGIRTFKLYDGHTFTVDVFEAADEARKTEKAVAEAKKADPSPDDDAWAEKFWASRLALLNKHCGLGVEGKRSCTKAEAIWFVKTVCVAADDLFAQEVELARPFAGSRIGTELTPAASANGS